MRRAIMKTVRTAVAGLALLGPLLAGAQESAETTSETASAGQIEEVIVTAQRREESIQSVPVAVTAVSGERLDALGAVTIQGMRGYIPNVQIQNFSNTPHGAVFNIRGMGVIEPDPYGGTTVVVTQDEVPQFFNMVSLLDTYDIERVEVMRGAQGTLFGANSTGGVIQAVSRRPQTDESSFDGYASYGNYDRLDLRGAINLPLIQDELAIRLALSHHQRDGFLTNVVDDKPIGDKDRTALRMSLLWEGSDRFDLTLIGEYSAHRDGTPHNINGSVPGEALHVPEGTMLPGAALPMYRSPCLTPGKRCKAPGKYYSARGTEIPDRADLDSYSGTLIMNWDTPMGTITSITGYKDWKLREFTDQDWTPVFLDDTDRRTRGDQFTQEIRNTFTVADNWETMIGVFYADYSWDHFQDFRIQFAAPGLRQLTQNDWDTEIISAFLHTYVDFSDRFRGQAGIRVHDEQTSADANIPIWVDLRGMAEHRGPGDNAETGPNELLIGVTANSDSESWTEIAAKVGVEYDLADDVMGYFTYAHGFKSGGFTGRIGIPQDLGPYDPEFVDMIEAGLKAQWLDNRLRTNIAVFHNWYDDIQLAQIFFIEDQFGNTVNGNTILNAAKAETTGVEIEVLALPSEWLSLNAAVGYLNAEYEDFMTPDATGTLFDLSGEDLQNAPGWTVNLGFDAHFMIADRGELSVNFQYKYTGKKYNTSLFNTARAEIQPTHLADLNVEFAPTGQPWSIGLWAQNLFDERYIDSVFDAPGVFGLVAYQDPRTYGVSLKVEL
ncbi:MAG: TonB-dependent receptor [Gammaproteobacteria bacterium]|nr:TonB-dependent receptor [Gammaproteobacteria bacterium]